MIRSLLIAFAFIVAATPAHAERLATAVSRNEVSITSSFDGETLTLFGNIEPDIGSDTRVLDETYHYLNMDYRAGLPAAECIWAHDNEVLQMALQFYSELETLLDE